MDLQCSVTVIFWNYMLSVIQSGSKLAIRKALRWFLIGLGSLILNRLFFLIVFYPDAKNIKINKIISQFLLGLRFDLATLPFLIGPIILIIPIIAFYRSMPNIIKIIIRLINFLQYPWLCLINLILIASTINYKFNNKHLGWEFYAYFKDAGTMIITSIEKMPLASVFYFLSIPLSFLLGYIMVFGLKRNDYSSLINQKSNVVTWKISLKISSVVIAILILMTIAIRGGLQENPIRSADAIRGTGSYINTLPLNGIFTIIQDRKDIGDSRQYYKTDDNHKFVQNLLGNPDDFPSKKYPLLRWMKSTRPFIKTKRSPNIVLIILESFTGKYLRIHGGNENIAPNLNGYIQNGLFFKRFFSSGGRSANGIICMMTGLPDRAGRTLLRSAQIQNRFGGIASLMAKKGYRTFFVHGSDIKFDNLNRALPHLGFQTCIGKRAMKKTGLYHNITSWGYHDEDTFDMMLRIMDNRPGQPFFGVVFTLNTHHPFTIPDKSYEFFDNSTPQHEFLNSYRYTDACLGRFMQKISKKQYYKNTYFLFVADHTHHVGLNYLEDRIIPFLIYAPGRVPRKIVKKVASQLDILPTILALSGGNSYYAAMGRDLTDINNPNTYAFFAGGSNTNVIGWIENDRLLTKGFGIPRPFLLTSRFPAELKDLYEKEKDTATDLLLKTLHFHQFARSLEKENRIWPPADDEVLKHPHALTE